MLGSIKSDRNFQRNPSRKETDAFPVSESIEERFTHFSHRAALVSGRPPAFAMAVAVIALWLVTGPLFNWSDTWQLVVNTATTVITFLMVFLIQNSQNRDAAALQAKLDEIIRSMDSARNDMIGIEHLNDRQIEEVRADLEHEAQNGAPNRNAILERLLKRR